MGDQTTINALRKEIAKVEGEFQEQIEQKAHDLGVTVASIDHALEYRGWITASSSPELDLEKIDVNGKMRGLYVQTKKLEKALQDEEERP
jgi:hypothetical protein